MNTTFKRNRGSISTPVVAVITIIVLFIAILAITWVTTSNREIGLRNAISAKQRDNVNQLDRLKKTITQVAEVSKAEVDAIIQIVVGYRAASAKNTGSLATALTEAVPSQKPEVMRNLANTISAERSSWAARQTELLDLKRAHDDALTKFPGSLILSGRAKIEVQIVTSTEAQAAMESGVDDNSSVFGTKK